MKFSFFKEYGALNSKPVFEAFEESVINAGHVVYESDMHCDVAVIWSVLFNGRMTGNKPVWDYYRKTGRNVIVLEVGSIERGTTWKVGLNGINRDAYFGPADNNSLRVEQFNIKIKPWRTEGEYILIAGQHDKSLQWRNMPSMSNWFLQVYDEIRTYTDRPIIFRPHPRCQLPEIERGLKYVYRQNPIHISGTYDDYDINFDDLWATVNWSSNPGIQSIIQGVPAIVGPNSLAFDVAEHDYKNIEKPAMPDRTQWLNDYVWTEYTIDEIKNGLPLERLTNMISVL